MKYIALVTGASSGIGREFVLQIASSYSSLDEIWVLARREAALQQLKKEVREKQLRIFPLDLSKKENLEKLEAALSKEKPCIRILVNSAGCGRGGTIESQDWRDACHMLDVNCRALTVVTMLCLPYLKRRSRIIQVDSGSAFLPQPGFGIYAASKSYVLSFDRALGVELTKKGISVTSVCPGPVDTEFFRAGGITLNSLKKMFLAKPEKVVRKALFDAEAGKAISIYGISVKAVRFLGKLLPHKFLLDLMGRKEFL